MPGINKVILIGNVGKDPIVKQFQSGDSVANFSLATSESYKNKDGKKVENTEWHKIVCFKKLSEIVDKYVKKGSKLYIEGKIKTRKWDKDGVDHYITEIIADKIQFIGSLGEDKQSSNESNGANNYASPDQFDNDIPF